MKRTNAQMSEEKRKSVQSIIRHTTVREPVASDFGTPTYESVDIPTVPNSLAIARPSAADSQYSFGDKFRSDMAVAFLEQLEPRMRNVGPLGVALRMLTIWGWVRGATPMIPANSNRPAFRDRHHILRVATLLSENLR